MEVARKYRVTAETTGGTTIGSSTKPTSRPTKRGRRYQMPSPKLTASAVAMTLLTSATCRLSRMLDTHSGSSTSVR